MNAEFEEIHLKKGEVIEITADMIIADIIVAYPDTLPVFEKFGIHCVGCYASTFESIEEGVMRHGMDPEKICRALNEKIRSQSEKSSKKRKKARIKKP